MPDPVCLSITPDCHCHIAITRFNQQTSEDDLLLGVVVTDPATTLISGELHNRGRLRICWNSHEQTSMVGNLVVVRSLQSLQEKIKRSAPTTRELKMPPKVSIDSTNNFNHLKLLNCSKLPKVSKAKTLANND